MLTPLFKELHTYKDRLAATCRQDLTRLVYLTRIFQDGHCVAIKVKFIHTGKMLKFMMHPEPELKRLICQRLEKTTDLVRDIHRIHTLLDEYTVPYHGDIAHLPLDRLWSWLGVVSEGRSFPMERPLVRQYSADGVLAPDQLYYGLITGYRVHVLGTEQALMSLTFLTGDRLDVVCSRATALNATPGLIWVGNGLGHYRIAKMYTIRYHVQFDKEEYNTIMEWITGPIESPHAPELLFTHY